MGLLDILQNSMGGTDAVNPLDKLLQQASSGDLSSDIAAMMRSDSTPPFASIVGQLFGQSSSVQQAGLLNQILAAVGPAVLSGAAGGAIGQILHPGQTQVTPDQASQLSPAQVTELTAHAEQHHPGLVDQVSAFYAQHSDLLKTLGAAALTLAMAQMKERTASR